MVSSNVFSSCLYHRIKFSCYRKNPSLFQWLRSHHRNVEWWLPCGTNLIGFESLLDVDHLLAGRLSDNEVTEKMTLSEALLCSDRIISVVRFFQLFSCANCLWLPDYVYYHNKVCRRLSDCLPRVGPWGGPWSSLGQFHQMVWWLILATQCLEQNIFFTETCLFKHQL